jgi:hypothetical protein
MESSIFPTIADHRLTMVPGWCPDGVRENRDSPHIPPNCRRFFRLFQVAMSYFCSSVALIKHASPKASVKALFLDQLACRILT